MSLKKVNPEQPETFEFSEKFLGPSGGRGAGGRRGRDRTRGEGH